MGFFSTIAPFVPYPQVKFFKKAILLHLIRVKPSIIFQASLLLISGQTDQASILLNLHRSFPSASPSPFLASKNKKNTGHINEKPFQKNFCDHLLNSQILSLKILAESETVFFIRKKEKKPHIWKQLLNKINTKLISQEALSV